MAVITCMKCGAAAPYVNGAAPMACPVCGAIYAKVAMALRGGGDTDTPQGAPRQAAPAPPRAFPLRRLLFAAVAVLVGGASFAAFTAYSKRQAALEYCGADRFAAWSREFHDIAGEFDRVAAAAGIAPRMTVAPLILRMSEAHAKAVKLPDVPCAAEGAKLLRRSMASKIEAMHSFALQQGDAAVGALIENANTDAAKGGELIESAARRTVK